MVAAMRAHMTKMPATNMTHERASVSMQNSWKYMPPLIVENRM